LELAVFTAYLIVTVLAAAANIFSATPNFWPIMRRAFAVIRPARILLIEAEVCRILSRKLMRAESQLRL